MQNNDSSCTGLAKHALVLGSCSSTTSAISGEASGLTIQRMESQEPESLCLAHRATVTPKQGFSDQLAARNEAPQRFLSQRGPFCQMV